MGYVYWSYFTIHKFLMKLVLGSESPRRKELLYALGYSFRTLKPNADESIPEGMEIYRVPEFLAELKSEILMPQIENDETIICADTIVVLENQIIGKPLDYENALSILKSLSGKTHQVLTGVNIRNHSNSFSFTSKTEVTFANLSHEQIDFYIREFKPFDKAGSYGIQDWIGISFVKKINGSYTNVMGLPTCDLKIYLDKI